MFLRHSIFFVFKELKDFKESKTKPVIGLDKGYVPEKILGALCDSASSLAFLVKWKDVDLTEMVPNEWLKEKYPMTLIDFYEKNLVWDD